MKSTQTSNNRRDYSKYRQRMSRMTKMRVVCDQVRVGLQQTFVSKSAMKIAKSASQMRCVWHHWPSLTSMTSIMVMSKIKNNLCTRAWRRWNNPIVHKCNKIMLARVRLEPQISGFNRTKFLWRVAKSGMKKYHQKISRMSQWLPSNSLRSRPPQAYKELWVCSRRIPRSVKLWPSRGRNLGRRPLFQCLKASLAGIVQAQLQK